MSSDRRMYRWVPAGKVANSFISAIAIFPQLGLLPVVTVPEFLRELCNCEELITFGADLARGIMRLPIRMSDR
jgi:hypothetical protein